MQLSYYLILAAILFCAGMYGVVTRKNGILVLMSVELMLNAVTLNMVAFSQFNQTPEGLAFALFIITIAAAEIGVGLGIVLLITRNLKSPNIDKLDQLKG